jgi:NADH:ubiquinone oxidoreductase 49 kD subunit 7
MATTIEHPDSLTRSLGQARKAQESGELLGEQLTLNMGPSHPSTHGVLRIVLELDGEVITKATPDIGYLHRGDEKIAENMQYDQFVPYTDRLDYLAPIANNVAPTRTDSITSHRLRITSLMRSRSRSSWVGSCRRAGRRSESSAANWPGSQLTCSELAPWPWISAR